jgi:hypothetical protein
MQKLSAINIMLVATKESPVTAIDVLNPSVASALAVLDRESEEVQGHGYWFNRDTGMTLAANIAGEIVIPTGILSIDPSDTTLHYVRRGTRMYNPNESTYVIGEPVDVDVTWLVPFDDLPSAAQAHILARATYWFVLDSVGDVNIVDRLERRTQSTRMELNAEEIRNCDLNIKHSPYVARLIGGVRPRR